MVTKPEVRALALARLAPRPGVLIWDVGAGSGSVAVECARFGAAVIAVERDPAQCARVAANARRHGADVRVVTGAAPEALDGLPDADAVFVGGGGLAVLTAVAARRPARIVVALAAVERVGQAAQVLGDAGLHGGRHPAAGQPPGPVAGRRTPPGRRQPGLPPLGRGPTSGSRMITAICGGNRELAAYSTQTRDPSEAQDRARPSRAAARAGGDSGKRPRGQQAASGRPGAVQRARGAVMIGLIAVTAAGQAAADRLARAWPGETRGYHGPAATALPRAWAECDALVCFLATGATIRLLAPLLAGKHSDPAVVCVDEAARHAIALLGGHGSRAGAPPGGNATGAPRQRDGARTHWRPGSPRCWARNPCSARPPTWPECPAWTRWAGRWKARSPRSAGPCWTASRWRWPATPPGRCPPSRPTSTSSRVRGT